MYFLKGMYHWIGKFVFFYQLLHMLYYLGPKHFPKGTEVIPPDLPTLFKNSQPAMSSVSKP